MILVRQMSLLPSEPMYSLAAPEQAGARDRRRRCRNRPRGSSRASGRRRAPKTVPGGGRAERRARDVTGHVRRDVLGRGRLHVRNADVARGVDGGRREVSRHARAGIDRALPAPAWACRSRRRPRTSGLGVLKPSAGVVAAEGRHQHAVQVVDRRRRRRRWSPPSREHPAGRPSRG